MTGVLADTLLAETRIWRKKKKKSILAEIITNE